MTIPPLMIQPGTTNIFPDPTFAQGTTHWTETRISNVTQAAAVTRDGVPSGTFQVTDVSGLAALLISSSVWSGVAAGTPVVQRWFVRASQPGRQVRAQFAFRNSGGATLSSVESEWVAVPTSGWAEVVLASVTPADNDRVQPVLQILDTGAVVGDTYWVVQPQAEVGTRPTAFVVGTRPEKRLSGFLKIGSSHIGPMRVGKELAP